MSTKPARFLVAAWTGGGLGAVEAAFDGKPYIVCIPVESIEEAVEMAEGFAEIARGGGKGIIYELVARPGVQEDIHATPLG